MRIKRTTLMIQMLALFALLNGCKLINKPTLSGNKQNTTQTSKLNKAYNASKTRYFDLLHTKLELSPDWEKQQLKGKATLLVKPYFYPQNQLILDAKGMDIHDIKIESQPLTASSYTYDKKQIIIKLQKNYSPQDSFYVEIDYTAKPNELPKGGSAAITEDKGLYFINADGSDKLKPKQLWTQGETEASSCWFPTIDATNERCTQEMFITADTSLTVLTNGEFVYSKKNVGGTKTEYWKMDLPHAPYLFMMAIGKFAVVEDQMPKNSKLNWQDFELKYYVDPPYKTYAKGVFGNTPEMIDFFSDKLGVKFPWNKYSQVVVHDFVSGAMENTTASVFMEALHIDDRELLDRNWDFIIAHELFHQWFGDLVTCESWANLPLNESFANYSEYLWAEHKFGKNEAFIHAESETNEYFEEAKTKNEPLIRFHYHDKEDMFDRHSYNKGGRVLHMLRILVGDEAFFKSLQLYLNQNKFKPVEIHHLRLAFEEITGLDLNWFFNQWFMNPGHPKLSLSHEYKNNNLEINIKQIQDTSIYPVYRLPLQIAVWEAGQKKIYPIEINRSKQTISLPVAEKPNLVLFDAQHQLLAEVEHTKTDTEWMYQYYNNEEYPAKIQALRKLFERPPTPIQKNGAIISIFSNKEMDMLLAAALKDSIKAIRGYALEQFSNHFIPNMEAHIKTLVDIANHDSKPKNQAVAMNLLASLGGNTFDELFIRKLDAKPYSVVGAALGILVRKNNPIAKEKAKEMEALQNITIALALAQIYVNDKDSTKFWWFNQQLNTGDAQKQYNLLFLFEKYLALLPNNDKPAAESLLKAIANKTPHQVIKNKVQECLSKLK